MKILGFSKPKYFNSETGEEIKLERELSIKELSSSLEIDPEFKTDSEFDFESFRKLDLELSNKSFELEPFDWEQFLDKFCSQANQVTMNINWLLRTIKLKIVVPNHDIKKMLISALRSSKKEAFVLKSFKKLKVIVDDCTCWDDCHKYKGRIYVYYTFSEVNMPYEIKKFFEIKGINKFFVFLREIQNTYTNILLQLMKKYKNLREYTDLKYYLWNYIPMPKFYWKLIQ